MSTFRDTMTAPQLEPKINVETEGSKIARTTEEAIGIIHSNYDLAFGYERSYFRRKGDKSGKLCAPCGTHAICHNGKMRTGVMFEVFELGIKIDPETKRPVEVRKRVIEQSFEGEPIFPEFSMDAWQAVEDLEPAFETGWITESGWQETRRELEPIIAHDKALAAEEKQWRDAQSIQLKQAADAKRNPQSALAKGIAEGVAEALRELGITKKPKAA